MKFTALLVFTLTALAAGGSAWSDTAHHRIAAGGDKASADARQQQRQALEQQDEARYRVCDPQRVENPGTRSLDFTAEGRRCLIDALDRAASVQGAVALLRNASVSLRKTPEDHALRAAALRAIDRARTQLAADLPSLRERFRDQAAALDLAEFSIHLPHLHHQQQQWRLEAYLAALQSSRQD